MSMVWDASLSLIEYFLKYLPAGTALVMKFNFPASEYNSQLVAFLVLIILVMTDAMSCSLSSGTLMTMSEVSNVRPKNYMTVVGPSDFSGVIGMLISLQTSLNAVIVLLQISAYL